ncbi:MAG: hypothetical protein LQ340_006731 [Diploschistes diacapsis]|nr:MAG: hypothetical protein LQ340_006731 [Diploschistes diacapsis]
MSLLPSISSLLSPPEAKPLDQFNSLPTVAYGSKEVCALRKSSDLETHQAQVINTRIPPSPPDSPRRNINTDTLPSHSNNTSRDFRLLLHDRVLYPNGTDGPVCGLLFDDIATRDEKAEAVAQRMRCHYLLPTSKGTLPRRLVVPTEEKYVLMDNCVSRIGQLHNHNPGAYLKRTREETDRNYKLVQASRLGSARGRAFIRPSKGQEISQQHITVNKRAASRVKRSTFPKIIQKSSASCSKSESTDVKRSSAVKKHEPPSFNFNEIPDFSPALSTLPDNVRSLSVDWQGNALDLSCDPNRHLLHEAEVFLASRLRLTCASYLCVKRRIFVGRVNNFVREKKFTKTDAQSCGHIDVNKSSKIWTAYDKAGWFDRKYFEDAIDTVRHSSHCYDPALQCVVNTSKLFG